jgi:hypothetical protein
VRVLSAFQKLPQEFGNPVTNNNSWIFYFTATELTISKGNILRVFKMPDAYFSNSGIFDGENETFPYAVFEGIRYENVCGGSRRQLVGPFVARVDAYWPVVAVYDQEGLKVF